MFTSGFVNTETILHFFYKITNERGTKIVFTYARVKWFYGQSERAYYLNYFINIRLRRQWRKIVQSIDSVRHILRRYLTTGDNILRRLRHYSRQWENKGIMCTIGGLGRHIGRQSTDISVDYRSTIGRQSTDYRSTVDRLSVDCRPTIGRLSTDIVLNHRYSTDT